MVLVNSCPYVSKVVLQRTRRGTVERVGGEEGLSLGVQSTRQKSTTRKLLTIIVVKDLSTTVHLYPAVSLRSIVYPKSPFIFRVYLSVINKLYSYRGHKVPCMNMIFFK